MFAAFLLLAVPMANMSDPTVADFFPLIPGTIKTYEDSDLLQTTTTDEVGQPLAIEGQPATPVYTRDGTKLVTTTYYRVEGNTVFLVGYDPKAPLPRPEPILQLEGKGGAWNFFGPSTSNRDAESLRIKGEAHFIRDSTFFGTKKITIESRVSATVGDGPGQDRIEQRAVYATGIGLVELETTTRLGRQKATARRKLIRVEEAKSNVSTETG